MRKYLVLMVLFGLMLNVNAACVDKGDRCSKSSDCCGGAPYCYGGTSPICRGAPARIGVVCTDDASCQTNLICAMYDGGKACGECAPDERSSGSLEWDWTSTYNVVGDRSNPVDRACLESGTECICNIARGNSYDGVRYYPYGVWLKGGAEWSIGCSINEECYETDNYCNMWQNNKGTICVDSLSKSCNIDSHCNDGYYCKNHVCYLLPVGTTTTSPTTTTSTMPYQVSTTTLIPYPTDLDIEFCDYTVNISASSDDGYSLAQYNGAFADVVFDEYVDNAGLKLYQYSGNNQTLLNLTFRNFPIGFNVRELSAELIMYTKFIPSENFNFTYNQPYGVDDPETQLGLDGNAINLYTGFDQSDLNPDAGSVPPLDTGFPSPATVNEDLTIDNDTWFSFDVSTNLLNQLKYYRDGEIYRYNDNVTLNIMSTMGGLTRDFEVYSYDDDTTKAPFLCLYDVSYIPAFDECQIDGDCLRPDMFCNTYTGFSKFCQYKSPDYITNPDNSLCYRNHECLSGICSEHNDNGISGDYPAFSIYGRPYIAQGDCLQSPFKMSMGVSPSTLSKTGYFRLWLASEDLGGNKFYPDKCNFYFTDYTYLDYYETNWSWAYSNESIDASRYANYSHSFTELRTDDTASYSWTHTSTYPLFVSPYIDAGYYDILSECTKDGALTSIGRLTVEVGNSTFTKIKYMPDPPTRVRVNDNYNVRLNYLDFQDTPLSDADCILRFMGVNHSMVEYGVVGAKKYENKVNFNETGQHTATIWCNLTGYDNPNTKQHIFDVIDNHCGDGVINYGELGVDCGGECPPCDTNLRDEDANCKTDADCKSGWCKLPEFKCTIPSCDDGIQNNGEFGLDCGGVACPPCIGCLYDSGCSDNGTQFCNLSTDIGGQCQYQLCDDDTDCRILGWYNEYSGLAVPTPTECDLDGYCRFKTDENQTFKDLKLTVTPLSGVAVNKSGTIFYVFNCDDEKNGFKLKTNKDTVIKYNFVTSDYDPSTPISFLPYSFGEDGTRVKEDLIPELCKSNLDGVGGLTSGEDSKFSKINFRVISGNTWITQQVDVITFRNSLENSLIVFPSNSTTKRIGTTYWDVSAVNRTIQAWVRLTPANEWVNITTGHVAATKFNQTAIQDELELLGSFQLLVNTSYNERFIYKEVNSLPLLVLWDEDKNKLKFNEKYFIFEGWMIPLIIGFILILAAYYNYKTRRLGGV